MRGAGKLQPTLAIQKPRPLNTPIANNVFPGNTAATHIQSTATTTIHQTRYRPLPTKTKPSTGANGSKKRKHTSKEARPVRYFQDPVSGEDSDDKSGDGTSSGDSIHSDAASKKRQKISRVATRSSTRGIVSGAIGGAPGSASLPTTTIITNDTVSTNTDDVVNTDVVRTDTDDVVHADADDIASPDTEDDIATGALTTVPRAPSPMSLDDIDAAAIPAFLLRHGTGKRRVNIFNYLESHKDSLFQPVLFYYLRLAIKKPESNGSLPTAERPKEISLWSSRARPACLPDYKRDGRTFTDFVDSIFVWWGSIQPSWRVFERGKVAREVDGGWDALCVPSINGLLNVVMLVYWWIRILEEDKPEDGLRVEYEFFANDVAWVLSQILLG